MGRRCRLPLLGFCFAHHLWGVSALAQETLQRDDSFEARGQPAQCGDLEKTAAWSELLRMLGQSMQNLTMGQAVPGMLALLPQGCDFSIGSRRPQNMLSSAFQGSKSSFSSALEECIRTQLGFSRSCGTCFVTFAKGVTSPGAFQVGCSQACRGMFERAVFGADDFKECLNCMKPRFNRLNFCVGLPDDYHFTDEFDTFQKSIVAGEFEDGVGRIASKMMEWAMLTEMHQKRMQADIELEDAKAERRR